MRNGWAFVVHLDPHARGSAPAVTVTGLSGSPWASALPIRFENTCSRRSRSQDSRAARGTAAESSRKDAPFATRPRSVDELPRRSIGAKTSSAATPETTAGEIEDLLDHAATCDASWPGDHRGLRGIPAPCSACAELRGACRSKPAGLDEGRARRTMRPAVPAAQPPLRRALSPCSRYGKSRIVHRRGCPPCQLFGKDQVMLVRRLFRRPRRQSRRSDYPQP